MLDLLYVKLVTLPDKHTVMEGKTNTHRCRLTVVHYNRSISGGFIICKLPLIKEFILLLLEHHCKQ